MNALSNFFLTLTLFIFFLFPWTILSTVFFLLASILCVVPILGPIAAFFILLLYLIYSLRILSRVWSNLWLYKKPKLIQILEDDTLWSGKLSSSKNAENS